jgi:hypothetical protein
MPVIINRRAFITGLVLLICFGATLAAILNPVFHGSTGLQLVDGIFNSLSKGSSYFIPDLAKKADKFEASRLEVTLSTKSAEELEKTKVLFAGAGAEVAVDKQNLQVKGSLGLIAKNALADADRLFKSGKEAANTRYGFSDRDAVSCWWAAFKQIRKEYIKEDKAAEIAFIDGVSKKALEPAYNYAGIPPAEFKQVMGISIGSLIFYILYTVWYGIAIMFIFEGLGITASKPAQKAEA